MAKLPMCRICLVKDVRMYVVVNKNLHELYEKLTDVPFVTEDSRPMLACFFCCTKLKQCWRFQRKCLEAEELFTQMMHEDYEQDPLTSQGQLSFYDEFTKTPVENINIVGVFQTESCVIKEELPDVSENQDDIIEPMEEHQTDESDLGNVDNSCPDVQATPTLNDESDSDDAPLLDIKTEVEIEEESIGAPVTKKRKLETRRSKPRGSVSAELKKKANCSKLSSVSKIIERTQNHINNHEINSSINDTAVGASNRSKDDIKCEVSSKGIGSNDINGYQSGVKDGYFKCSVCQHSFNTPYKLTRHMISHSDEKHFKCVICQSTYKTKASLKCHYRTHTDEKPFTCDICEHKYKTKAELIVHFHTHLDVKRFKCYTCQGLFKTKCNLVSHICTQNYRKPFKCDKCPIRFKRKDFLTKHVRTHMDDNLSNLY